MKVAILQPPYMGWVGLYALLDVCNTFVVYDDVQFEHQSWQNRNKIRNGDKWTWLTVPILHREGQLINEVKIDNSKHWREDHWKSIYQNYVVAPCFKQYREDYERIYQSQWRFLIELNITLMLTTAKKLGVSMPKIVQSSWYETEGQKTDRLIPILKAVGATEFIEGIAGQDYLDIKKMHDNGIEVLWFDYKHPIYPQRGDFISYLSAIDLLLNTGAKAIGYIRQGINLVKAQIIEEKRLGKESMDVVESNGQLHLPSQPR